VRVATRRLLSGCMIWRGCPRMLSVDSRRTRLLRAITDCMKRHGCCLPGCVVQAH
jgi:hypothetical protein